MDAAPLSRVGRQSWLELVRRRTPRRIRPSGRLEKQYLQADLRLRIVIATRVDYAQFDTAQRSILRDVIQRVVRHVVQQRQPVGRAKAGGRQLVNVPLLDLAQMDAHALV